MKCGLMCGGYGLVALLVLLTGCVSIERSYPDQHYFVLEARRDINPSKTSGNGVLEVADVRISPRYGEKSFVYRTSETRFESDFYNQFLVAPASVITEEVRNRLARSQIFRHVIGPSSQLQPTHVLETGIGSLYGDFRNSGAPKAVLEMEFFLSKEGAGRSEILMEKRYSKSVPLAARSAEALVKGWNMALDEILTALATDLKKFNN